MFIIGVISGDFCELNTDCTDGDCVSGICACLFFFLKQISQVLTKNSGFFFLIFIKIASNVGGLCVNSSDCTSGNCQGGRCASKMFFSVESLEKTIF